MYPILYNERGKTMFESTAMKMKLGKTMLESTARRDSCVSGAVVKLDCCMQNLHAFQRNVHCKIENITMHNLSLLNGSDPANDLAKTMLESTAMKMKLGATMFESTAMPGIGAYQAATHWYWDRCTMIQNSNM